MILAILLTLGALVWLPVTAGVLIVGAAGALWLLDQMLGAPAVAPSVGGGDRPSTAPRTPRAT